MATSPLPSGAHNRVELLRNPCILRAPQTRGQNQKWLPHPCLLRGQNQKWHINKSVARFFLFLKKFNSLVFFFLAVGRA